MDEAAGVACTDTFVQPVNCTRNDMNDTMKTSTSAPGAVSSRSSSPTGPVAMGRAVPERELVMAQFRLEALMDAGQVTRLHTVPTVHRHTIAEHVYGSMLIAMELLQMNRANAAGEVLNLSAQRVMVELLLHDAPEVETGDVPAPVKRASGSISMALDAMEERFYERLGLEQSSLNSYERAIVKAADTLDLGFACLRERRLGNRHPKLDAVFANVLRYLQDYEHIRGVKELSATLQASWAQVL